MKRKDLARRATSAALAACMMFTLSAPALAESTDALMQLSIGSYRSSSLLSEENGFPTITVDGKTVTEENKDTILGECKLSYDDTTKTLKSNGMIRGNLTIDAPGVNVELCNSTSGEAAVRGKLTVTNAQDVKVTAQSYVAVYGDVEISCDGKVEITSGGNPTVAGNVTVKRASTVAISGECYGYNIVKGDVTIACHAPVVIQNHGTGGMASSIVYSGTSYKYYTEESGTAHNPANDPIKKHLDSSYLRITPVTARAITVTNGTSKVGGADASTAYAGQTVTVTPDDRTAAGYQFVRWEVVSGIADTELIRSITDNTATFTMPDEDVKLWARYNKLFTVTTNDAKADVTTGIPGTEVTVTANVPAGEKFTGWKVECSDPDFKYDKSGETVTFKMPKANVTVTAEHKTKRSVTVNNKLAASGLIEGENVTVNAEDYGIPAGEFDHWESEQISLTTSEATNPSLTFAMPDENVVLKAVPKTLYTITVDGGTVNNAVSARVKPGDPVAVVPEDKGADWKFIEWEVIDAPENFSIDTSNPALQFNMPVGNVTLKAVQMRYRTITVNNGLRQIVKTDALRGETVEIKAEYDPHEKKFDHWEVKGPKGWDLEDDQKTNPEFTLTVPKGNVTLTAVYNDYHNITVEGGYATPDRAIAGTQITLTPNLPDDQEFDYWYSTDINLREDQRSNPNLTFKMRDFDIKITAVPKQLYFVDLEDTDTTANGEDTRVEVKTGEEVVLVAPKREGFRFNHWEVTSGTVRLIDADKTTAYFTMKSENVRIKAIYDEYHTITMVDGKGTAYDADGKEITSAVVGDKITIVAKDRDSHEFNHWEIDPNNVILEDPNAERTHFTMPDEAVEVNAKYKHLQSITMNHGTAYDEDFSETDIAKAKQTITIKAEDRYADGLVFDHWAVDPDNVILADKYGEKTTFEMVSEPVELTAHYKARVTVFSVPAKFEEGIGEHSDETWEKVGETATITAKIDEKTFPGMEFDYWEVIPTDLDIGDIHNQTISFEVPECEVKLVAHWKSDALNPSTDPDASLDPDFDVDPVDDGSGAGGAGAAIAGVAIGGAAVWGGYEIATRVILNDLLPAGAAIPANRGQLALLIWTEKGKPEPAAQPAFADITDAELAKAAQWCVEQGLLDAREGKFESDGWMPKFKTIEIWNKAFPKK